ncbi:hypothetical protein, partial [Faecalibaculum rodentium]|uniref:hypothetical protein n=1 Tax=Faecalibaculum rodentium TaxID=1702221 RepID=UPI00256EE643
LFRVHSEQSTKSDNSLCSQTSSATAGLMHSIPLSIKLADAAKSTISVAAPTVLWMIVRPSV